MISKWSQILRPCHIWARWVRYPSMSDLFSICQKIVLITRSSQLVKKLDSFKFDGVAKSGNAVTYYSMSSSVDLTLPCDNSKWSFWQQGDSLAHRLLIHSHGQHALQNNPVYATSVSRDKSAPSRFPFILSPLTPTLLMLSPWPDKTSVRFSGLS